MTDDQIKLVRDLLEIRNQVQSVKDINLIPELVDNAINKARLVSPSLLNEDVLGRPSINKSVQSSIELLKREKSLVDSGMDVEYVKFQITASLVKLMLKYADGLDVITKIEKQVINPQKK